MAMGWANLQNAKPDSFSSATLWAAEGTTSSVTVFVDPADIFVAQISLTQVETLTGGIFANAFISGITFQNGGFIDFPNKPNNIEGAWAQSVTFALTAGPGGTALATVTSYTL
jgi:hypothetical protein